MRDALVSGAVVVAVGLALVLASTWTRGHRGPAVVPGPRRPAEPRTGGDYLPCHSPVCAHMTRWHDVVPAGLACSLCGRVVAP
ncbi:hypothetical protein [Streptomyces sp. NPDC059783]|uniref:hypothetical protein n=1 Tax=Streptomyces sp. NPDC059783 TaxID=3346944 RepID=UPI0036503B6D